MAEDDFVDYEDDAFEWLYVEDDYPLAVSTHPVQVSESCRLPC